MKNSEEIELLNQMIRQAELRHSAQVEVYRKRLREQWEKVFNNDKQLEKDAENAQGASEYVVEDEGIYTWFKVKTDLSKYSDCREYLEEWLSENYGLSIDWKNDCFLNYLGNEEIIIQDDAGRDNGVYLGSKLIIDESEYLDDEGAVDEDKRNNLIEKHMEETGYFPGVFRLTRHGDVYLVNTQKKKRGAR